MQIKGLFMILRLFLLVVISFSVVACSTSEVEKTAPVVAKPKPPAPAVKMAPKPAPVMASPSSSPSPSPKRMVAKSASSSKAVSSGSKSIKVKPTDSSRPSQSGVLTAGEIDDNLNLNAFMRYIKRIQKKSGSKLKQYPSLSFQSHVHIQVVDTAGTGVSNARLKIAGKTYYTRTDGHFYYYPSIELPDFESTKLKVTLVSNNSTKEINTTKKGINRIVLEGKQNVLPNGLDLMFVIDTTGSMGDELRYIKAELNDIITRVKSLHPETSIRYGLVVYRDKGDQYVVRHYKFQTSLSEMQSTLSKQNAAGGGDYPEALDAAVIKGVNANWGAGNRARVMFLIADAPPHAKNVGNAFEAAKKAHQKGIRIYPLGASGVADEAEYVMRHMALITNGKYQFLTDDSGIGNKHQEPHVDCYVVTRLDQLITRTISSELSGRLVEPTKAEMIRRVGKYDNGLCR